MKQSTTSSTVRCSLLPPQLYFIRKATACLHSFIPICADSIAVGMVIVMETLMGVYSSWIDERLSDYNSAFYYQPRDYLAECCRRGIVLDG